MGLPDDYKPYADLSSDDAESWSYVFANVVRALYLAEKHKEMDWFISNSFNIESVEDLKQEALKYVSDDGLEEMEEA